MLKNAGCDEIFYSTRWATRPMKPTKAPAATWPASLALEVVVGGALPDVDPPEPEPLPEPEVDDDPEPPDDVVFEPDCMTC